MGHLFVDDVTSFMFGTSLKFRNVRWYGRSGRLSMYKSTKINNCKAGRTTLVMFWYYVIAVIIECARKSESFVASQLSLSLSLTQFHLEVWYMSVQLFTLILKSPHFAISHSHAQQTATQRSPFTSALVEMKNWRKMIFSLPLDLSSYSWSIIYFALERETLYAFNDDGRRILDNNFVSCSFPHSRTRSLTHLPVWA